jgi:transposase
VHVPYERIQTHFDELFDIPISTGSLVNFNADAYRRLDVFEALAKKMLRYAEALHADETGINVDGKRLLLHCASNDKWTLLAAHAKRGKDAMAEINILPYFSGLLIHDHWKPYYRYELCDHVLCNVHHKRELTRAYEQDGQKWALTMEALLDQINHEVKLAGGSLAKKRMCEMAKKISFAIKKRRHRMSPAGKKLIGRKKTRSHGPKKIQKFIRAAP